MRILGICRVAMLLAIAAFVLKPEAVADDRVLAVRCIRAKQAELESPGAIIGVPLHIQINTHNRIANAVTNYIGMISFDMFLNKNGKVGDLLLVYTNTFDNKTFTLDGQVRARILAVGGGGAGGPRGASSPDRTTGIGGGGGGGGVVDMGTAENPIMLYGGAYSVKVGAGGQGVAGYLNGFNGESSKIVYDKADWSAMPNVFYSNEIIAYGGGGGAYAKNVGSAGASGGGGSAESSSVSKSGGACSPEAQLYANKGNPGGDGKHTGAGAGGGGAGGRGEDTQGLQKAGNGGEGYVSDITGVMKEYAGGGGGGVYSGSYVGKGKGGGGNGNSRAGENGTGGGGGGAGRSNSASGRGGDGIVIIRLMPRNYMIDKQ